MEFLAGFILGMVVATGMLVGYGYYSLRKLNKAKNALKETLAKAIKEKVDALDSKRDSIIARLKQAQEITRQQLDLRDATDQPSKNALHSRYKNGLVGEIKKLEEEKIAILQSILDDGFDPLITVVNDAGEREELPLSHFVVKQPPAPPTDGPTKKGKFVILKGGKDDGTVH